MFYLCLLVALSSAITPLDLLSNFGSPLHAVRRWHTVDAFVACGGNPDETGSADVSKIVKIIKTDFGLDVDIEGIIDTLDVDGAGQLGFAQFKEMLTAS